MTASHPLMCRRNRRADTGCGFSQVEFCDNLIFRRRSALESLGEGLLDANRTIGHRITSTELRSASNPIVRNLPLKRAIQVSLL
jgi:hypothetical protein